MKGLGYVITDGPKPHPPVHALAEFIIENLFMTWQ